MGGLLYDWSVSELFAPVWLDEETCACAEGVVRPYNATVSVKLIKSTAFGTGGHPVTSAIYREIKELILTNDVCLTAQTSRPGRPRILEVDAGSGVLLFLAKKLRMDLQAAAVVAPEDLGILERNQKRNKILQMETIPFSMFATSAAHLIHHEAFDLIFTQRGQYNWQTTFDVSLMHFHHCLAPTGKLIYSGFPHSELPLAQHIFGEFFHVLNVSVDQGWPVLIGRPR